MKKTAVQHILPFAFLVVSATMITACEKGGPRTAKDAILKAKCERGYESNIENAKTIAAVSTNSNIEADYAIRTYLTKFELADATKESLLNPGNFTIISAQKTDSFSMSSDVVTVVKDCEKLTATVKGPGFEVKDLDIKDLKLQSIELGQSNVESMSDITVKIEKSARLEAVDKKLEEEIDKPENKKNKHKLKAALKNIQERQLARGNILTKVSIEVKGASKQSYVIEQHSGEIFGDARVDFDKSVLKMIADRTSTVGTPDFVKEALRAKEAKDAIQFATSGGAVSADPEKAISIDKLTGGRVSEEQAKLAFEEAKTIPESEVITILKEKLDSVAGTALNMKPIEIAPIAVPELSVAPVAPADQTKVEEKKPEVKTPEVKTSTLVPSVATSSAPTLSLNN
ncbi:MAG: hypothetical protein AABZ31_09190 [Bdellovibrionota bacterium]